MEKKESTGKMTPRMRLWLKHYFDHFNGTLAAKQAGYRCKTENGYACIARQNYTKLHDLIGFWFEDNGLSESSLKNKLVELLNAKETKFFTSQGKIIEERVVPDNTTRQKALDMAFKIKGTYAAEKKELSGKDGGPIETKEQTREQIIKELFEEIEQTPRLLPAQSQGMIND